MAHDNLNITKRIFIIDMWTDLACWHILVYILTSNTQIPAVYGGMKHIL